MEKELPKIDLPEDWVIGTGINKDLLSLYTNYPVRLKCEIFVLCLEGKVEASVNLNRITVKANDFVTLTPGSIFQINRIEGNLNIYFLGFSSKYIEQTDQTRSMLDAVYFTLGRPVFHIKEKGAKLMEQYLQFLNISPTKSSKTSPQTSTRTSTREFPSSTRATRRKKSPPSRKANKSSATSLN